MSGRAQLSFLGTGGSMGIPVVGCKCPTCQSQDPLNKRLRPSVMITAGEKSLLIDCGPDFRLQALRCGMSALTGVILTHAHHDHTAGIDELRVFYARTQEPLPCLLSKDTLGDLSERYRYIFAGDPRTKGLVTQLDLTLLSQERGMVEFQGFKIGYFTYDQGGMAVNGFRFGNLVYLSDVKKYPETIYEDISGAEHLIVSALRFTPSELHLTVDEALDFARKSGAKNCWFTHIAHELEHGKGNAYLPANVRLAYDGLTIPFTADYV